MELVAYQAHPNGSVSLLHVAVIGADVHDAGYPSSITGGEGTFVEGDFLDRLRLEDGEYAHHVVHVVDRDAVQQDEVLVGSATADIYSRKAFSAALDSRHHLEDLQHVSLAEEDRGVLDLGRRDVDGPEVGGLDAGVLPGHYMGRGKHLPGLQRHVYHGIPDQPDMENLVFVTHV